MTGERTRLLVPGDEFHASLAAVRALRAGGYAPYLAIHLPGTYAGHSRAAAGVVRVPNADEQPDAFCRALAQAAADLRVAALLPGTESALVVLAERRDAFPPGLPLGVPDPAVVELATDKSRLLELAAAAGLETPPTETLGRDELRARACSLAYPAIVKPLRSKVETAEGQLRYFKATRVASPAQLRARLDAAAVPEWVVQPYLDSSLAAVGGVAWEGRLVAAVHQVSHRVWPPDVGYSSYAETVAPDAELELQLADVLVRVGWSGLFQAQFLLAGGARYLIDFNPRPYGSTALAVAAGANLPALWADLVLGREPRAAGYRPGVRYRLEHNDVRALLHAFRRGDRAGALRGLAPHRGTVHAVFSWRDPLPVLTTLAKFRELARGGEAADGGRDRR